MHGINEGYGRSRIDKRGLSKDSDEDIDPHEDGNRNWIFKKMDSKKKRNLNISNIQEVYHDDIHNGGKTELD